MALKTQFTDLYFVAPANGGAIVEIGCVTSITGLTAARDQIETTCLNSAGRTYESGMPTPGAATFTINFDPSDESHMKLHALYASGEKVDWALGLSDYASPGAGLGPVPTLDSAGELDVPGTRSWIVFNGYVSDFPFDLSLNSVVTSNLSVQVSDFPQLIKKV